MPNKNLNRIHIIQGDQQEKEKYLTSQLSSTDDNIVDRDEDQFDKKSDEAHHDKPDRGSSRDFCEFYVGMNKLSANYPNQI